MGDDLGGELVLLPDEVLQVDEALRARQVLLEARELLLAGDEQLDRRGRQHRGHVLAGDRAGDRGGDGAGPLAPEALGGAGVALVDRRHLLGLDTLERLDPALALRHDLPVAAEEDVEEDADERQEDEDEQPGERDRRLAVVHDEQDDR